MENTNNELILSPHNSKNVRTFCGTVSFFSGETAAVEVEAVNDEVGKLLIKTINSLNVD